MARVVHVVAVIVVFDVNVVGVIPIGGPVFGPWVDDGDPAVVIAEAGASGHDYDRKRVDAEAVRGSEINDVALARHAVSVIASAVAPAAMFVVPMGRAMLVPHDTVFDDGAVLNDGAMFHNVAMFDARRGVLLAVLLEILFGLSVVSMALASTVITLIAMLAISRNGDSET